MTKDTVQNCWWHPQREATYIVNLGTPLDGNTPACLACAVAVQMGKETGPNYKATIVPITKDIYDQTIL